MSQHSLGAVRAAMEQASKLWYLGEANISLDPKDWRLFRPSFPHLPKDLDAITINQISTGWHEAEFLVRLSKALMKSASELLDFYTGVFDPICLKLSKGLESLPDDVISLILKSVDHSAEDSFRNSLRLSQVSRRFRSIVREDQTFWGTLYFCEATNIKDVQTSISLSGNDIDLNMIIKCRHSGSSPQTAKILEMCASAASTSHRWRSLVVSTEECGYVGRTFCDEFLEFMHNHNLMIPRLEEVHFAERPTFSGWGIETWADVEGDANWFTPGTNSVNIRSSSNLRVLRCTEAIPSHSLPFEFTSLMISLTLNPDILTRQIQRLTSLLGANRNVSDIKIELKGSAQNAWSEIGNLSNPIVAVLCPTVSSLAVKFSMLYPTDLMAVIIPTMKTLRMPKLRTLAICVETSSEAQVDVFSAPGELLPNVDIHPLITSITLEIRIRKQRFISNISDTTLSTIDIPLEKIPDLSFLCITVPAHISFSRRLAGDGGHGIPLISLRELELRSCDKLSAEGLQYAVQNLKDVGAWEALERLTIRNCNLLNFDEALAIVGKERLCMPRW